MERYCKGKIHINGKDYKWLIGEEFAKLVALSLVENEMMEEIKEEPTEEKKPIHTLYTRELHGKTYVHSNEPGIPFMTPIEDWNKFYETDHDKTLDEIHGVVDVVEVKPYKSPWEDSTEQMQLERLTNAVLQLQQQVFNQ